MSIATLTLDGEAHVILPHAPDWGTKPKHVRSWLDGLAAAVDTAEDRQSLRDQPVVSLGWEILPCDPVEARMLEDRVRAALKSGLAVSAYWGRAFKFASAASGSTIYLEATRWRFHAGQKLFFRVAGRCSHEDEWEIATVEYAHPCRTPVLVKLTGALTGSYPAGGLCWPLIWGKFEAEELAALNLGRGTLQVRISQRVPFPTASLPVPDVPDFVPAVEPAPGFLYYQWLLPDDALWADVQRRVDGGEWEDLGTFERTTVSYTDQPTVSGNYCYRARSRNCFGVSDWTEASCVELDLGSESGEPDLPQLASVFIWLDAADAPSPVNNWPDQSGNSNHATQSDAGLRPTVESAAINGLPAVLFSAGYDKLQLPDATWDLSLGLTIFAVLKADTLNNDRRILSFGETTPVTGWGRLSINGDGDETGSYQFTVSDQQKIIGGEALDGMADGAYHLVTLMHGEVNAQYYLDGVAVLFPTATSGPLNVFRENNTVGNNGGAGTINRLWLAELVVIRRTLGSSDREAWENYLLTKYGL